MTLTPRRVEIGVIGPGGDERRLVFEASTIRFGRTVSGNDVAMPSPRVAKRHARFFHTVNGWLVVDLKSTSGVYVNGARVGAPVATGPEDDIRMGDYRVRLIADREPDALLALIIQIGNEPRRYEFASDVVTLGRATECEIAIDEATVSRKHLWFRRRTGTWSVETHSGIGNGTAVNGVQLVDVVPIRAGDRISIGDIMIEVVEARAPR